MYKSAEGYEISPYKLTMYKTAYSVHHKTYVGIEHITYTVLFPAPFVPTIKVVACSSKLISVN